MDEAAREALAQERTVHGMVAAYNAHDIDALMAMMTADPHVERWLDGALIEVADGVPAARVTLGECADLTDGRLLAVEAVELDGNTAVARAHRSEGRADAAAGTETLELVFEGPLVARLTINA